MKTITVYIIHHCDRGMDDRAYVSVLEPPQSRVEALKKDGYTVFRANIQLPVNDSIENLSLSQAEECCIDGRSIG